MSISIKKRIYLSFTLLVFLFVVNGGITIGTLLSNKKISGHVSTVVDPSLQGINDLREIIIESKMYSTNWVFLRYNQNDKDALIKLHDRDYKELKLRINVFSSHWDDKIWIDSLNKVYSNFEELLLIEKSITRSLKRFEDYDNPVVKLEAERIVEDEIIPRTASVLYSLEKIIRHEQNIRKQDLEELEISYAKLRFLIAFLAISFIFLGIFLSVYFSKIIISPIEKIKHIINNLGKGITQIITPNTNKDEIGEMIFSVNNLSQKLQRTATFAREVGIRNFNIPFEPLSEDDTLGKALVAMRDNLKYSDAQLNEAQHIAHLGSWERDHKTDRLNWSDEMFCIFEVDRTSFDFRYHSFLNLVHPDDIELLKRVSKKRENYLKPVSYEFRIVTPKGSVKTIYIESSAVLNDRGEIIQSSGIAQDITERKKASLALEEAHGQLKTLFENVDQALFSFDVVKRKVLQLSSACERIYGYGSEHFFADYDFWKSLVYKDDLHIIDKGLATLYSGLPVHEEYRVVHRHKGIVWVEAQFAPAFDHSGKLIRIDGVVSDIQKRKTAELDRDKITADLIHRNKDLEQFTYIVSHNLRAPVTNIMALSTLLTLTAEDAYSKEKEELLNGLSVSINKLDGIILDLNQILTVRTPGYEKKEKICLLSMVEDIKASIKHLVDKENVTIECDFQKVKNVVALKSYLYSIFYNLILNSIKYKQPDSSSKIQITSRFSNRQVIILFKDNGRGIDVIKNGKELFKLYKRFDTTVEGKGIGLYMVKTAVETLGGTIALQSEPDKGCEFRIELPAKTEEMLTGNGFIKTRIDKEKLMLAF